MLEDATLLDLVGSIAAGGFFPGEPLLVCPEPEGPPLEEALTDAEQTFRVVEGNRRLGALLLVNDPDAAPSRQRAVRNILEETDGAERPTEVPAIVFTTRREILDHLGFRHITGIKEWSPLAKARYVRQLAERAAAEGTELSNQQLARMIGSKGWYVARLLTALGLFETLVGAGALDGLGVDEEDDVPFSLLLVALGRPKIVEYLGLASAAESRLDGLNPDALQSVARWMFKRDEDGGTALGESRNMKYLAQAVTSPASREALDQGASVQQAAVLALDPAAVFRIALKEANRQLALAARQKLDQATDDDLVLAREHNGAAAELLDRLEAAVAALQQ